MSRMSFETNRTLKEVERDLCSPQLSLPVDPRTGAGGAAYNCVPSQSILGKMLAQSGGGFSPTGTGGFFIRTELFAGGPLPAAQQYVKKAGQIYRIINVDTSADQAYVFLDCVVKDREA
jgi:hypothetical protein